MLRHLPWLVFLAIFTFPLVLLFSGVDDSAASLSTDLLREAQLNTLWVGVQVVTFASVFGLSLSWIVQFIPIKGRRFLRWGFILPLVFPPYVLAFVLLGALVHTDYSPQGQIWGLVTVLSLALFPYIYIFTGASLRNITQSEWEAHQLSGRGCGSFLMKVIVPKIMPLYVSASMLVLFETLADFGAASILNVTVYTTIIYRTWFELFSFAGAVSVSAQFFAWIAILMGLEWLLKRRWRDRDQQLVAPRTVRFEFSPTVIWVSTIYAWAIFTLIFVFPSLQLLVWAFDAEIHDPVAALYNTFMLALACAVFILLIALSLSYGLRWAQQKPDRWESVSTIGYSVPGTILAVATLLVALSFGFTLTYWASLAFLLLGLCYKFFPVGFRQVGGQLRMISPKYDEFSKSVGAGVLRLWGRVHWPLLKGSLMSSMALIGVEVMKEMPITLMLAPSSMKTLSIQIYNFTSEGEWEKAAIPALILVGLGLLTVHLLPPKASDA